MRRLLTLAATVSMLAMLGLSSITASAASSCSPNPSGTTTCTMNLHGATYPVGPPNPPCIPPDATGVASNVNAVFHITINGAGDSWSTGTIEGDVTLTVPSTATTYTGHFSEWFGSEANNKNFVNNMTFNAHLTAPNGSTIAAHLSFGFGVSASGQPIMHMNMVC
jgi:hypothetical protein